MLKRTIALIIIIAGLTVFIFPRAFTEYKEYEFKKEKKTYTDNLSEITEEELRNKADELIRYNEQITQDGINGEVENYPSDVFQSSESKTIDNESVDTGTDSGSAVQESPDKNVEIDKNAFGYIEIPKLDEYIPIYLGATEENLYEGVAHVAGTSMPIGGIGTHSVIAGHRGYSKARLFRYIDQLKPGDKFYIYVLGNKLSYQVNSQMIITPDDVGKLMIKEDKDLVSLLSCYPYPYMSHRIVVTGSRIPNDANESDLNANINYKNGVTQEVVSEVWKNNNENISEAPMQVDGEAVSIDGSSADNSLEVNPEIVKLNEGFVEEGKVDIKSVKKKNYMLIAVGLFLILLCLIKLIMVIKEDILQK